MSAITVAIEEGVNGFEEADRGVLDLKVLA